MNPTDSEYFPGRKEWRKWLESNHDSNNGIWLIYYKKHTGIPRVHYDDAVEEALCFGWIDSTVKKLDEERYMQKFTQRKDKSNWSELNKKRVAKLIKLGLMTESGMVKIKAAKKNGEWNRKRKEIDPNKIPLDLKKALSQNKVAISNFMRFAPSYRKNFIGWIESAKREETRQKRIDETVGMAERNEKPGMK